MRFGFFARSLARFFPDVYLYTKSSFSLSSTGIYRIYSLLLLLLCFEFPATLLQYNTKPFGLCITIAQLHSVDKDASSKYWMRWAQSLLIHRGDFSKCISQYGKSRHSTIYTKKKTEIWNETTKTSPANIAIVRLGICEFGLFITIFRYYFFFRSLRLYVTRTIQEACIYGCVRGLGFSLSVCVRVCVCLSRRDFHFLFFCVTQIGVLTYERASS